MKFLDTKEISDKSGDVAVIFKPVTTVHQAALLGYQNAIGRALKANDIGLISKAKFQTVCYALGDMVNELTIEGKEFDPKIVASSADISDPETIDVLNTIFDMVVGLLVQGETKKKLSKPHKSTRKGKGAKSVPGQTKG